MASTFPEKSRPLHNFCLPQIKWSEGHTGTVHQRPRSAKSPSRRRTASSASPVRHSPPHDLPRHQSPLGECTASSHNLGKQPHRESLNSQSTMCGDSIGHSTGRDWNSQSTLNTYDSTECRRKNLAPHASPNPIPQRRNTDKPSCQRVVPLHNEDGAKKLKTLISVPRNVEQEEDPAKIREDEAVEEGKLVTNDEESKRWNLRPRKSVLINAPPPPVIKSNKSGEHGGCTTDKKEKQKLSIAVALSKEEIEMDIFSMTGSKPPRRPKKRPRNIQKDLNSVFPGLWLLSINADTYKVSESSLKG